jgi:TatD DNase family protein
MTEVVPADESRRPAGSERETLELVDSHCHLDFDAFDEDRQEILQRASESGVRAIILPSVDLSNIQAVLTLTRNHSMVYAAVGIHPTSTAGWHEDWLTHLRDFSTQSKVVAVGEIGLDYYWDKSTPAVQQRAFNQQLELAAALELPVIVHNREASDDVIRLLAASPLAGRENPGVLHSFSGDWSMARAAMDLGYYLGFTGPLTYKKAEVLREIAARAPLERVLIETDAPFLAPHPYRGRRNEPAYVRIVAERLAEIRRTSLEAIAAATTANAHQLFRLS